MCGSETFVEKDKRLRIIEGAIKVFARQGFYKAKIEEIAEQAGVGKGTVYEYFSSKKELFLEMFFYIEEKYQKMFREEISAADTFADRLQKMFEITVRFLSRYREMAQILLAGYPPVSEDTQRVLQEKRQRKLAEICAMLEEAMARQEIRPVDSSAAAQVILGALFFVGGQVLFPQKEEEPVDCRQLVPEVVGIILQGLAAPGPGQGR